MPGSDNDSPEFTRQMSDAAQVARELANRLKDRNLRAVFAESCSGGMAAALMTQIPGISGYFCGSAVTYRQKTKTQWLSVAPETLAAHTAESAETTQSMAKNVLQRTAEANWSAAITGHLESTVAGGHVFVAIGNRQNSKNPDSSHESVSIAAAAMIELTAPDRKSRQLQAARLLLETLIQAMDSSN